MIELIAGIAWFVFVFFKAMQQRNVAWMRYKPVMPISYAMATTQILVIGAVSLKVGVTLFEIVDGEIMLVFEWGRLFELVPMILVIGTGGGLGAMAGMWIHHKFIGEKK